MLKIDSTEISKFQNFKRISELGSVSKFESSITTSIALLISTCKEEKFQTGRDDSNSHPLHHLDLLLMNRWCVTIVQTLKLPGSDFSRVLPPSLHFILTPSFSFIIQHFNSRCWDSHWSAGLFFFSFLLLLNNVDDWPINKATAYLLAVETPTRTTISIAVRRENLCHQVSSSCCKSAN